MNDWREKSKTEKDGCNGRNLFHGDTTIDLLWRQAAAIKQLNQSRGLVTVTLGIHTSKKQQIVN